MSAIQVMVDSIAAYIDTLSVYAPIVYGSDPPDGGICMIQNGGFPADTHMDKGMIYSMPLLLNGKNLRQDTLLNDLTAIHEALTKRLDYSPFSSGEIQVINIATTAAPMIIGREQNAQWTAGSSLEISFYWR